MYKYTNSGIDQKQRELEDQQRLAAFAVTQQQIQLDKEAAVRSQMRQSSQSLQPAASGAVSGSATSSSTEGGSSQWTMQAYPPAYRPTQGTVQTSLQNQSVGAPTPTYRPTIQIEALMHPFTPSQSWRTVCRELLRYNYSEAQAVDYMAMYVERAFNLSRENARQIVLSRLYSKSSYY